MYAESKKIDHQLEEVLVRLCDVRGGRRKLAIAVCHIPYAHFDYRHSIEWHSWYYRISRIQNNYDILD
uniref:Uncharacterized protein n=1 Tax=Heterorhabditis bacteriophora TaxID=37862 RepID=A0A1I7WRR5_HETBA